MLDVRSIYPYGKKTTSAVDKYAVHSEFGLDNCCNPSKLKKIPQKLSHNFCLSQPADLSTAPPQKKGFKVTIEVTPKKNAKQKTT